MSDLMQATTDFNEIINTEVCPDCGGSGILIEVRTDAKCCGRWDENGRCCGYPEPDYTQVQEQCIKCEGTGLRDKNQQSIEDADRIDLALVINKAVDDTLLLVEKYAKDWHTLSNEEFEEIINSQKRELLIEFQRIQNEIINTNLNDNAND